MKPQRDFLIYSLMQRRSWQDSPIWVIQRTPTIRLNQTRGVFRREYHPPPTVDKRPQGLVWDAANHLCCDATRSVSNRIAKECVATGATLRGPGGQALLARAERRSRLLPSSRAGGQSVQARRDRGLSQKVPIAVDVSDKEPTVAPLIGSTLNGVIATATGPAGEATIRSDNLMASNCRRVDSAILRRTS